MTIIFLSNSLKIDVKARNGGKPRENVVRLLDNCIWIRSFKFTQFWIGYLPSIVHVLTIAPSISHITKRDIFKISFAQSDGELRQKWYDADFSDIYKPLTCWLSNGVLKLGFLDICLTTYLVVLNSGNTLFANTAFFLKCLNIGANLQMEQKNE